MSKKPNKNNNKKSNKSKLKLDKELIEKIPYTRVFEEEGIIETEPGVFTKCYFINKMNFNIIKDMDSEELFYKISSFLNSIDSSLDFQFILHNKVINQDSFRDNVMLRKRPDGLYEDYLRNYNEILINKLALGNNNVKKDKYFVISYKADIVEDAINKFRSIDTDIRNKFNKVCGIEIVALSIVERLRVIYNLYNLGLENQFGHKVNFNGASQNFSFKNMKHLKLTTKDVVGPMSITVNKDYLKINDKYVRTFFLNNVPSYISENFISDTSNVSPNMIVSIHYNSFDHVKGLELVTDLISKNTVEQDQKKNKKKATLKNNELALSKRNAPKSSILVAKELNEETYFNEEAKKVLTEANSINQKIFNTSVVITLYADDIDTLDIDTEVLMMSANKFLCQFKTLDYQQLKGFNACLPLCINKLSINRVFNCEKASTLVPLNIQEILKRDGLYYGLNRITENVILLNRNNSKNKNGFIMGQKGKGKTFAAKREILNTLISTNDHIIVLSKDDAYDKLAQEFNGDVIDKVNLNPFKTHVRYSDQDDASVFKKTFLNALFTSLKNYVYGLTFEEQEEINLLINHLKDNNYTDTVYSIQDYLNTNNEVSKVLCKYLYSINDNYKDKADTLSDKRLAVYKTSDKEYDNLILLDAVWNKVIENAGKNIQTWVYIENIDGFFSKQELSNYMKEMYSRSVCWPVIITGIVKDNETFTKNPVANATIQDSGYVKLLSQGPVERQVLATLLNLSNSILPYISNVNAGQGLIVTPAANMTFDDIIDNKFLLNILN